ncbi:MAG: CcdB family protein [Acidobacteria bacterium]|jgi:hypothetical protein|nr:CcdB family protein [Acidobacteriota bacterium]
MNRLAVFSLRQAPDQLVLVLSDPQIALAGTVVAAPLKDAATFPVAEGLNPRIAIGDSAMVLATEQLAAIPVKSLGRQLQDCIEHEYAIANAINRLFFGI